MFLPQPTREDKVRDMPITGMGPACGREGCSRALEEEGLCRACLRLARLFGRDPAQLLLEPLNGPQQEPALQWEELSESARCQGVGEVEMFLRASALGN